MLNSGTKLITCTQMGGRGSSFASTICRHKESRLRKHEKARDKQRLGRRQEVLVDTDMSHITLHADLAQCSRCGYILSKAKQGEGRGRGWQYMLFSIMDTDKQISDEV